MGGQATEIFAKIDPLAEGAGSGKSKLLIAQIFITDKSEKPEMNIAWRKWLTTGENLLLSQGSCV
jgi:enamine deaminase RidA (YjgF/YER057c/UK114 family)